jgi:hypothetical protein
LTEKDSKKVLCPKCKNIGRLRRKPKSGIQIPQKSQLKSFNDLLDFFSIYSYKAFMNGMKEILKKFNGYIEKNFDILLWYYRKETPFLLHSQSDLHKIENELLEAINISCNDKFTAEKHSNGDGDLDPILLQETILFLYSYISFESLKQFLESGPIDISRNDLVELVYEILNSVQYIVHDNRARYHSSTITKHYNLHNNSDSDAYHPIRPVDFGIRFKCLDCKKDIYVNDVSNMNRVRCKKCNPSGKGSSGKIERYGPSQKYIKNTIEPKILHRDKNLLSSHRTFILIRDQFLLENSYWKNSYLNCFEDCKSKILDHFRPPVRYTLAIAHYLSDEQKDTDCNLAREDQILDIHILNTKYHESLVKIVKMMGEEGDADIDLFISAYATLIKLNFPFHLINMKLAKDLQWCSEWYSIMRGIENRIDYINTKYRQIFNEGSKVDDIKQLYEELQHDIEFINTVKARSQQKIQAK